jgi:tetratricopeptide (TPR) repeat protein
MLALLCFALLVQMGMNGALAQGGIPGYPSNIMAYDAREVAMLPRYCIHTKTFRATVPGGNDPAEVERLKALLGPVFEALHHYCWGLMRTHRGLFLARDKQVRIYYLRSAIEDYNYVLVRASPQFPLLPEILTKKGENLALLQDASAATELRRAIEIKPDYWPAYAALSDFYKNLGHVAKSREVLEEGLSVVPDAKPLMTRLSQLGRNVKDEKKTATQK